MYASRAPIPSVPYRQFTKTVTRLPVAGCSLTLQVRTSPPAYQDPAGTVLHSNPILLDDAGYNHIYLSTGVAYKLVQTDHAGVQQWEVDHVYGTGGGGSGTAGVGWGKNTVLLRPAPGSAQAAVAVFPLDTLALGLTVWCDEAFGVSQGLQHLGLGTTALPDCWGLLPAMAEDAASTAGMFLVYGGQPMPQAGMVTLTAYGGLFDGTGQVLVTGHFLTLTPGHEVGLSYTPGTPTGDMVVPPQPPATETNRGLIELATAAEVATGTDAERAVTPATLASRVAAGTALSVARYALGGAHVESTPGLLTSTDGRVGIGGTAPPAGVGLHLAAGELRVRQGGLQHIRDDGTPAYANALVYNNTLPNSYILQGNRAAGTEALPQASPSGQSLLRIVGKGHDGASFPTSARTWIDLVTAEDWTPSAQGTALIFGATESGTTTQAERLRIDGKGNLEIGGAVAPGTGLTKGLVLQQGVVATTFPADVVQVVAEDHLGAGTTGLTIATEGGFKTRIGKGINTPAHFVAINLNPAGTPYVLTAIESATIVVSWAAGVQQYVELPPLVMGLHFNFMLFTAAGMRVTASAGVKIRLGTSESAAGGYAHCATVGSSLRLVAINPSYWQAFGATTNWTVV